MLELNFPNAIKCLDPIDEYAKDDIISLLFKFLYR